MRRRLSALVCVLLLTAPLCGCWVFDEIDSGQKWMADHSAKREDAVPQDAKAEGKPAPTGSPLAAYEKAQAEGGKTRTFTPGQVSEDIVACKLGGKTQFMKREHCAARGGQSG